MYDVQSYISPVCRLHMAERVGFEPTVRCRITGFQDRLLKPLGHPSAKYYNRAGQRRSEFLVISQLVAYGKVCNFHIRITL